MGAQQEEMVSIERRQLDVAEVAIAEDRVAVPWE